MEYKLSKSEFYRLCFLVAGILFFLFLFGILNLSSYASSFNSSAVSVPVNESYSETYGIIDYNYDLEDYSFPVTTITTHSSGSGWSRSSSSNTCRGSNTIHLVTSEGDFVVNVSQGVADGSNTNHTVTVLGVPERVYSEFEVFNNTTSVKSVYAYSYVDSISVADVGSSIGGGSHSSDYSSYSPVNTLNNIRFYPAYSDKVLDVGSLTVYNFDSINTSSLDMVYGYTVFSMSEGHHRYCFNYTFSSTSTSNPISDLTITFYYNGVPHVITQNDFTYFLYNRLGSTYRWTCSAYVDVDSSYDQSGYFVFSGNTASVMSDCCFTFSQYKATIDDYMNYVKENWNNISPSVTDTNQNIAQSVSDIGTAQNFESGAFTDFDSSMSSSGLDSFSLSFASTPLLWCASIINTFYNNMPSGFQYLLMFVAFVGILVIVLNIAGRVVRRFGGD